MKTRDQFYEANEAALSVVETLGQPPPIAIVLGSGLGGLVDRLTDSVSIPYGQIPHFPRPTVAGHSGHLLIGSLGNARVLALQGRFHYYEGHEFDAVTFPIRFLQRLGVTTLVLTAAAGAINQDLAAGDLVGVTDHLNLIGTNPLRGPNDDRFGVRFLDMTEVYSSRLRTIAHEEAERIGVKLKAGVYASLPGPTYETPAEIRMLRAIGADLVGMSTVPEAIVARHAGMEVLALVLVSNMAAGVTGAAIAHDDVLEAGKQAAPRLGALIEGVVGRLSGGPNR